MKTNEFIIMYIMLGFVIFTIWGTAIYEKQNQEEEITFNDSFGLIANPELLDLDFNANISSNLIISEPSQFIAIFSPDYKDVEINGEICQEVTCECAKDTRAPCMSICYHCEEKIK